MERAIDVSSGGHASMPPTLWGHYLGRKYQPHLPGAREKTDLDNGVMWVLNGTLSPGVLRHDALLIAAATEDALPICVGGISG